MNFGSLITRGAVLLCATAIAACSNGGDDSMGTVSISLMDRPVDGVTELHVTISEIWLKPAGDGPAFELPMTSAPLTVNLLELNDENASVLVDNAIVKPGSYNWIEMKIEDTDIAESYAMTTTGGAVPVDVDVPSGKIRLVSGFDVGENQAVRFLFDWDVRKGLTDAVGRDVYLLRPAFRILDADEYGAISGSIAPEIIAACGAEPPNYVVYVFAGNVTSEYINANSPESVTSADVKLDDETGEYRYRAVIMPENYTVAFSCDDGVSFLVYEDVIAVTVSAEVEDVNF